MRGQCRRRVEVHGIRVEGDTGVGVNDGDSFASGGRWDDGRTSGCSRYVVGGDRDGILGIKLKIQSVLHLHTLLKKQPYILTSRRPTCSSHLDILLRR